MRKFYLLLCALVALVASAQYGEPGYYRVHTVYTDRYISIKGTKYKKTTNPDAFWSCILMTQDSAQVTDPGSIIYIPRTEQTSLYSQGVDTYSLTGLWMDVLPAKVMEGGRATYVAKTEVVTNWDGEERLIVCYFRDIGTGLTAGTTETKKSRWWIEPVNESTMDTSYFAVKPANENVRDDEGWYWTTLCCDFPFTIPAEGGVEGAYTIQNVEQGTDGLYYAAPVKVYGQGETVPGATPVLLKCRDIYASGNKLIPTGDLANNTTFPLKSDLLKGNYFSTFVNHSNMDDATAMTTYIPTQATKCTPQDLVLGVDAEGKLGFYPQAEGTYIAANTAWLSIDGLELDGVDAVYVGEAPQPELIPGDVNGDYEFDINDVTFLLDYLLGAKNVVNISQMDFNQDGDVDINDVTAMIDSLLQ